MDKDYAEHILRAMIDAVIVMSADGIIMAVNEATYALLGYQAGELDGKPVARIFADEDAGVRSTTRMLLAKGGSALHREEVPFRHKTGAILPVSVTGAAVLDARGDLSGIVLVARDLRETQRLVARADAAAAAEEAKAAELAKEVERRKQAEADLKRAKESVEQELDKTRQQLLHAERLATLGTLAGGVGHELSNIATVFLGNLDRLRALPEGALPDGVERALSVVGKHMITHADRLLSLARPGQDYEEPLDLREIVTTTLEMLHDAGKTKYVDVETELPGEPVMVTVNRTRVEQILVNLVGNAADALAQVEDRARCVRVVVTRGAAGRVVCQVADNGPGIPADSLDKIFDTFYTTKPKGRGTGLGLPVVRQIVEAYGGKLAVASLPGHGATFTFDLPPA
jgi:PAS domain S-box-containing protein